MSSEKVKKMTFLVAFFCPIEYNIEMAETAKNGKNIMELLTDLDEHIIKTNAIAQAAKDFVTLKETLRPLDRSNTLHEVDLAYTYLKELVS